MRIGVDTGGTFTDLLLSLEPGAPLRVHKLPSSPEDPARAVLEGMLALLSQAGLEAGQAEPWDGVEQVIHGSTVATNALLEGKGGRAALVGTAGFEELLWLGRQHRRELYALAPEGRTPPLERRASLGIEERLDAQGEVLVALEQEALEGLRQRLSELEIDAVAVCLLHSYANPIHEAKIASHLQRWFPGLHVTVSHELSREFREYERASTCLANAVVAPPMSSYIGHLSDALGSERLRIMASSGGQLPPESIEAAPVHTIVSGPAGGVVGAFAMAEAAGEPKIITVDMGGTSTDVSLCDGHLRRTTQTEIAGMPVRIPLLDIETVGAGGGSIAWLDGGGALQVGPHSAGAQPGPACYGRQKGPPWTPTVTDAHLVLGHLSPQQALAGSLKLRKDLACNAIAPLAQAAGMPLEALAHGILRVAEAHMARAVQRISVQRGFDPRDFALVPFGGAGGLHACALAELIGIRRILLPTFPGLLSALGMLLAAPFYELSQTLLLRVEAHQTLCQLPQLNDAFDALHQRAQDALAGESFDQNRLCFAPSLDLRYAGQSYTLNVPYGPDAPAPLEAFAEAHRRQYGYVPQDQAIEIVHGRLTISAPSAPAPANEAYQGELPAAKALRIFDGQVWSEALGFRREQLPKATKLRGPVLLFEYSATTLVAKGWGLETLDSGQILIVRQE